jgi:hypothetical protein
MGPRGFGTLLPFWRACPTWSYPVFGKVALCRPIAESPSSPWDITLERMGQTEPCQSCVDLRLLRVMRPNRASDAYVLASRSEEILDA